MRNPSRFYVSYVCSAALLAVTCVAGCTSTSADGHATSSDENALTEYDGTRGDKIADRALALWSGHPSQNLCLKGVGDSLDGSGVVSPAFPRLESAVAFDDWARANPAELAKRGFVQANVGVNQIPRGSIITWRPGQCGYHALYGHIEIVTDQASSRACSDYCGNIKKTCGPPGIFEPIGSGGPGSSGDKCSVHPDGKLYCINTVNAAMHADTTAASAVVNTLRTTSSWFDCWSAGELHIGGNTTWYHTVGDDNPTPGWVPGFDLQTPDSFDADPTARGLKRCGT